MAQDAQIQSRFLAGWNTTLNTNIMFATRARKGVENARLSLDAAKARAKGTTWKIPVPAVAAAQSPRTEMHESEISPESQEEIEKAEDEFVTQTEEAVGVMKNVSRRYIIAREHPGVGNLLTLCRSLIPLSRSATSPSSSPPRWSTTRRLTRSSASLRQPLRVCRSSRRQVGQRISHCLDKILPTNMSWDPYRPATERAVRVPPRCLREFTRVGHRTLV